MATYFWVGGSGTWDTSTKTNWSAISGGTGGLVGPPTSADNATFDGNSGGGTVTMSIGPVCANLVCTGFTGTFAGSSPLQIFGTVITFASGMTLAMANADIVTVNTAPAAFTTAGVQTSNPHGLVFNGSAAVTLQDDCNIGTGTFNINANTVNTNNHTVTCVAFAIQSGATCNPGSSIINCSSFGNNGTFTYGTSTINVGTGGFSPSSTAVYNLNATAAGGANYAGLAVNNNFSLIATGTTAISVGGNVTGSATIRCAAALGSIVDIAGGLTCAAFITAGNSPLNRFLLNANAIGTAQVITCTSANLANTDFQDITLTNSGSFTALSIGNCGRNTGITFPAPINYYWINPGASPNFFSNNWATSSGGTPGTGFPVPGVDEAIFDANSFSAGGITITLAGYAGARLPSIDFTGVTNSPTLAVGNTTQLYGAVYKFNSGMAISGASSATCLGNGTVAMETGGATWTAALIMSGIGGTLTFSNDFLSTSPLTHNNGTIDRGTHNITFTNFTSSSGLTRIHIENTANMTLTGTAFNIGNATGLTWTKGSGLTKFTSATTGTKTFTGAGLSFGTIYVNTTNTGTFNIVGSNTFNSGIHADPGRTIKFTAGTTTTVSSLPTGTLGNLITITSITAATHTLTTTSPFIACDYLSINHSIATQTNTFYAGAHSTDGGSNTNWLFSAFPGEANMQSFNGLAQLSIGKINGIAMSSIVNVNGI